MTSTESIEDRVFAFVARERGEPNKKLMATTTLLSDLGMDGDDAVEFLDRFAKEFSVDLTALGGDWRCYFGPEGFPLRIGFLIVVPGSIFSILLIEVFPRLPAGACFLLGFLFWIGLLLGLRSFRHKSMEPQITIQDLIDCPKTGAWTKQVPEGVKRRMATRKPYVGLFG